MGKWHRVEAKKPPTPEEEMNYFFPWDGTNLGDQEYFLVNVNPPEPQVELYLGSDVRDPALRFAIQGCAVFEIEHNGSTWTAWDDLPWWKRRTRAQKAANEFIRCLRGGLSSIYESPHQPVGMVTR